MSAKAPAFQWYAAEYLADERVMLMSLVAEGAYVRLLSLCWREGSIPANPALLIAMCKQADIKVIKEVLPCFTKVGAPPGRLVHKRLESERAKHEAHRIKQAENGRNGGRPKKAVGKPNETQNNPPLLVGETQIKANESSSPSTSSSTSSNEDENAGEPSPPPPPLKSSPGGKAGSEKKVADNPHLATFTADTFPGLTNATTFAGICADLRLPIDLDHEAYRSVIQDKMRGMEMNALATTLRSWIASFFILERKRGELLTRTAGLPTKATPKHELPPPKRERPGQVITIVGDPDQQMNRMLVASAKQTWPQADIHSLNSPRA